MGILAALAGGKGALPFHGCKWWISENTCGFLAMTACRGLAERDAVKWAGGDDFGPDAAACLEGPHLCSEQDELQVQKVMGSKASSLICVPCASARWTMDCADSILGKEERH